MAGTWEAAGCWDGAPPPAPPAVVATEAPSINKITIERAIAVFLAEHSASANTQKKYRLLFNQLKTHSESKGYVPIDQWGRSIREFRASWEVSPVTAAKNPTVVKSFFEFALVNDWNPKNPARLVKEIRGQAGGKGRSPFSTKYGQRLAGEFASLARIPCPPARLGGRGAMPDTNFHNFV